MLRDCHTIDSRMYINHLRSLEDDGGYDYHRTITFGPGEPTYQSFGPYSQSELFETLIIFPFLNSQGQGVTSDCNDYGCHTELIDSKKNSDIDYLVGKTGFSSGMNSSSTGTQRRRSETSPISDTESDIEPITLPKIPPSVGNLESKKTKKKKNMKKKKKKKKKTSRRTTRNSNKRSTTKKKSQPLPSLTDLKLTESALHYIPPPPHPSVSSLEEYTNFRHQVTRKSKIPVKYELIKFKDKDLLMDLIKKYPFDEHTYGKNITLRPIVKPPPPKEIVLFGVRTLRGGVDFFPTLPSTMSGKPYKYEIRVRSTCPDADVQINNDCMGMTMDNFDRYQYSEHMYEYRFIVQFTSHVGSKDDRQFNFLVLNGAKELVGKSQAIEIRSKRTPEEYKFWRMVRRGGKKKKKSDHVCGKKRKQRVYYDYDNDYEEEEEEEEEEDYQPRKKKRKR